jgi:phosphoribosyl-AMP cyclohydrolase
MRFDASTLVYDAAGLIPAVAQDETTGEVLMLAWMNRQTVELSLRERRAVYWSRSRREIWRKGETSGHTQDLIDMRIDCDRDCLLLIVRQSGPACHTGRRSCFYTAVTDGDEKELAGA